MSIVSDLGKKFVAGFKGIIPGSSNNSINFKIHDFLINKSFLRSTHFLLQQLADSLDKNGKALYSNRIIPEPYYVEDFEFTIPKIEFDSVGFADNQYTFPLMKSNEPIKLTITIADDENGSVYAALMKAKMNNFSNQGRFAAPSALKIFYFKATLFKPDGTPNGISFDFNNCLFADFTDVKYSYSSLTEYQKYSVTFICDLCDFAINGPN